MQLALLGAGMASAMVLQPQPRVVNVDSFLYGASNYAGRLEARGLTSSWCAVAPRMYARICSIYVCVYRCPLARVRSVRRRHFACVRWRAWWCLMRKILGREAERRGR